MPDHEYRDRQGNPIDQETWTAYFADQDYQHLAKDTFITANGTSALVSTVWIGNPAGIGLFETMVFELTDHDRTIHGDVHRWDSEAEATTGHATVLQQARTELGAIT